MKLVSRLQFVIVKRIALSLWFYCLAIVSPSEEIFAQHFELKMLGSYHTGVFAQGAAEIAAYDPASKRLFFVNANAATVDVLDLSNPGQPVKINSINATAYGAAANSVSVKKGVVAVAIEANPKQNPGKVVFFDANGNFISEVAVGALPDALVFTPDGNKVVVANEGEPSADYTVDPEGSVSVIDISGGAANPKVATANFASFIGQEAQLRSRGIRIYGPKANAAQDFEPEYPTVSDDSKTAYVTLQENNAIAVIDLNTATVTALLPLGFKDHNAAGKGLDGGDRDGGLKLQNWPLWGMYLPDAIASLKIDGQTYLFTANEGDTREYSTYVEEVRIASAKLDSVAFPNSAALKTNANLGRLKITSSQGDTDGDGDYDKLYTFGGRSFSIWDTNGNLVFDSGDDFERLTAQLLPGTFNSDHAANNSFDTRSDDKGPEPEAIVVGWINNRAYAFIGLERIGGVFVYEVTNPRAPVFVTYANQRDFSINFSSTVTPEQLKTVGDLGPESVLHIAASESPNAKDLLVVANEISGSVSIFQINVSAITYPASAAATAPKVIYERNGVKVFNGGFGSGMAPHPTLEGYFYLLTDRGPNFESTTAGQLVFPVPKFAPQVGLFQIAGDSLRPIKIIDLKDSAGNPITGLPNPAGQGGTGETAIDLDGRVLAADPNGLDPEGVVALKDGSFWISDEYGPHILHVDANGKTIERINPFGSGTGGRKLPKVFGRRRANRGMEGLAITPDGKTLVGIMQSALDNPFDDRANIRSRSRLTRILTFDLASGATKQFIYLQEIPNLANSEIIALSNTEFHVLERDGNFPGNASAPAVYKRVYKINLSGATDVSDAADAETGKLVNGKTLEQLTVDELKAAGIVPVSKTLVLDILVNVPGYAHDKPEGIALVKENLLAVVNDDDFGIATDGSGGIMQKLLPRTGQVDRNIMFFVNVSGTVGVAENGADAIPIKFELQQNYPNPFNPSTNIVYVLPRVMHVRLAIYDVLGREVATLVDMRQSAGAHSVRFDANGFGSGLYFYRLETEGFTKLRKMLLNK
jgi:3-phytase